MGVNLLSCYVVVLLLAWPLYVQSYPDIFAWMRPTVSTAAPTVAPGPVAWKHPSPSPNYAPVVSPGYRAPSPSAYQPAPGSSGYQPAPSPGYIPIRKLVAVQGVVYCKPCNYKGVPTLLGAAPLPGATVRLQCNNTRILLTHEATTDRNGYFFLAPTRLVTTYGSHKCKVFLASSPSIICNQPTDLHFGQSGAGLIHERPHVSDPQFPFTLFTVGPFAFEPKTCQ
ncbi:hypothetical protein GIB67_039183 [Kingdonia uniflora]|uniref:Uncharacterized protein n=1 Tax=Kingdonia uniflora TaxID=39325 RepID=A0A7J7MM15_9MAGN|nr:hypothetical protein GIB67_039183 [Kingdonia uniflora]